MPRIIKEMLPRIISEDTETALPTAQRESASHWLSAAVLPLVIRGSPYPDLSSNRVAEVVHHTYITSSDHGFP